MTQVDVSLTDYGLAVECTTFAYLITRLRTEATSLRQAFVVVFLSISVAAVTGGTVHGFFLDESSTGYRILWPLTLIFMGTTGLSGVRIGTALQFPAKTRVFINKIALVAFISYVFIVLFVRRDFLIAILAYLPALIFIGVGFLLAFSRRRRSVLLIGFLGICLMLFAAAVQQAKIEIEPRYFDHNALYHLLQAIELFICFCRSTSSYHKTHKVPPPRRKRKKSISIFGQPAWCFSKGTESGSKFQAAISRVSIAIQIPGSEPHRKQRSSLRSRRYDMINNIHLASFADHSSLRIRIFQCRRRLHQDKLNSDP